MVAIQRGSFAWRAVGGRGYISLSERKRHSRCYYVINAKLTLLGKSDLNTSTPAHNYL